MRLTQLLCAIVIGVSPAVTSGRQAARASALPDAVRMHVQNERFQIVTSIRGLPLGVRNELGALFGTYSLDIAEPGTAFQDSGTADQSTRPVRRLITAGCSYDHCLVYYERGGARRSWRAALFHWTPDATRFEGGGSAPGGLETVDAVRAVVLSEALRDAEGLW
jgi:hypothetical protein